MRPETCLVAENTSQSNKDPWHTPQCSHWPAGSWPTCPPEPQSCVSSVLTWLRRTMDLEGCGLGSDNVGPILRPPQPPENRLVHGHPTNLRTPETNQEPHLCFLQAHPAECGLGSCVPHKPDGWVGTWDMGPPSLPWALPHSPEIHSIPGRDPCTRV